MCLFKLYGRYKLWIDSFEIHPFWLTPKNVETKQKFNSHIRKQVQSALVFVCILHWIYGLSIFFLNTKTPFNE